MGRIAFRNKQPFWYALCSGVAETTDEYGNHVDTHPTYGKPVLVHGNVSPATGNTITREFGNDVLYDKVIIIGDRDTPIDENTVLWVESEPDLDANGALKVNASGDYASPWDYIVRKVGRGLTYGDAVIAISKVNVS